MEGEATKNKLFLLSLAPETIFFPHSQSLCEVAQGYDASNRSLMKCCFKIHVITTMYMPVFVHLYIGTYSARLDDNSPKAIRRLNFRSRSC